MKRVLTVGLEYSGEPIDGVEFETLGLISVKADKDRSAYPLYEYDVIVINPQSYSHFLFGAAGEFSGDDNELGKLKKQNGKYDLDSAYDGSDREKEMNAAIEAGATVVWCLAEPRRMNFFGYRETYLGYAAPEVKAIVKRGDLQVKKGRRISSIHESPFEHYFEALSTSGWTLCLSAEDVKGFESVALTPEGYSLGGKVSATSAKGWLVTPPTSEESTNRLILDALSLEKENLRHEKYHGVFLSHTSADKPFVRQLRDDLKAHGVSRVWIDEAEIEVGDSLIAKIDEGIKQTPYIAVVLSSNSIKAPWVKKELNIAINREISQGRVVVLPLLYEKCEIPAFLSEKLYADFTSDEQYEESLQKVLRKLRIRA